MPLSLDMNRWGGWREGAGRKRKPGARRRVAHRARDVHKKRHPVSLTFRVKRGLPSLRRKDLFKVVRGCIRRASREDFWVVHFSVQGNHLHVIAEAEDGRLSPGVAGLSIRIARWVNRALDRQGAFWDDRYHVRTLTNPRQVRNAYVYVLMNAKKHLPGQVPNLDPCSSAVWFQGFVISPRPPPEEPCPVSLPRTWLATEGWLRHGLIHPTEAPAPN